MGREEDLFKLQESLVTEGEGQLELEQYLFVWPLLVRCTFNVKLMIKK